MTKKQKTVKRLNKLAQMIWNEKQHPKDRKEAMKYHDAICHAVKILKYGE